MKQTCYLIMGG